MAQTVVDDQLKDERLPPVQRAYNYAEGMKAIKEHQQNLERQITINDKMQKAKDQKFEDAVVQDSASGSPTVTENDIKTTPGISPEARMRMLAWQRRDGLPEPMAKVSQANATDLFKRMALPDDDPNHITDLGPIRAAYGDGKLSRADEEWLEKRFVEARSPEGDRLNKIRGQFSTAVAPTIDKSNPLLGKIDQDGKLQTYRFERFVDAKVEEYRKAGKSPYDLFDPNKPDYLGNDKTLAQFKIPLQQSINNAVRNLGVGGSATPAPAAPAGPAPRQPGETPADYLKRVGAKVP